MNQTEVPSLEPMILPSTDLEENRNYLKHTVQTSLKSKPVEYEPIIVSNNWRIMWLMFSFVMVFAAINVAISSAILSYQKVYYVSSENVLTSTDGHGRIGTADVLQHYALSSESTEEELSALESIEFVSGEDDNFKMYSFKPTTYIRSKCVVDSCTSPSIVHFLTSDAVLILHGEDLHIGNPSENLKSVMGITGDEPLSSEQERRLAEIPHIHNDGKIKLTTWIRFFQGVGKIVTWASNTYGAYQAWCWVRGKKERC